MLRYIRSTLFPRIPFHRHRASSRAPLSSQPLQCSGSFLSCVLYMDFSFASALNAAESADIGEQAKACGHRDMCWT